MSMQKLICPNCNKENGTVYVKYVRRNSWSGGGFGVEGAIKGHIQAEMLNVGNVFLHSIRDKSNREEDRNQIEEIKKALYMNPDTLECMVTALNQVTIMG